MHARPDAEPLNQVPQSGVLAGIGVAASQPGQNQAIAGRPDPPRQRPAHHHERHHPEHRTGRQADDEPDYDRRDGHERGSEADRPGTRGHRRASARPP